METFTCTECGQERTGKRRRCYVCHPAGRPKGSTWSKEERASRKETHTHHSPSQQVRERISQKLKGVKHSDERKANIAAGIQRARNQGRYRRDPGSHTRGKPSRRALPVGARRVVKDGRVQVKCADGKWRYRSRIVWQEAYGPLTSADIVHHVNHNPMDDRLENLQRVTRAEHARIHNTPEVARARQTAAVAARKRNGTY